MAIDHEPAVSAAQMAIDTVCITYRDGRYHSAFRSDLSMPSVADRSVLRPEGLHLQNLALERRYRSELIARNSAHTIYSDTEAHHIELVLGEPLNTCGIEHMVHRLVAKALRQRISILLEKFDLTESKLIT